MLGIDKVYRLLLDRGSISSALIKISLLDQAIFPQSVYLFLAHHIKLYCNLTLYWLTKAQTTTVRADLGF